MYDDGFADGSIWYGLAPVIGGSVGNQLESRFSGLRIADQILMSTDRRTCLALGWLVSSASTMCAAAATYNVGPGQPLATPADVPWESLLAGDTVRIHWRATPYLSKWVKRKRIA